MVIRMATLKKISKMSMRMLGKEKMYKPALQMENNVAAIAIGMDNP